MHVHYQKKQRKKLKAKCNTISTHNNYSLFLSAFDDFSIVSALSIEER